MEEDTSHNMNLRLTGEELQKQIRLKERELSRLQDSHREQNLSPASQANIITTAFENLTNSKPFLPFPHSVLPSLLAMRKTHNTITESNILFETQISQKDAQSRQLEADKATLRDQKLLTEALTARIESLEKELASDADLRQEDTAQEKLEELGSKTQGYASETKGLLRFLRGFIKNDLAPMLAAEELGGPVVGELMDIDSEDLAGGFNAQGKLKKATKGALDQDKRQRRIDEIWGAATGGQRQEQGAEDEISAAGQEMRTLIENLLNRLATARGDNSESYVTLERESAAARFLIRSKVAQFHPKDSSRIRLVDFGRELEE